MAASYGCFDVRLARMASNAQPNCGTLLTLTLALKQRFSFSAAFNGNNDFGTHHFVYTTVHMNQNTASQG